MTSRRIAAWVAGILCLAVAMAPALAQTSAAPLPVPYGPAINIGTSKKVAAAAVAEARRAGLTMAIALDKARSSARFKRPTKAMQDILAAGGEGMRFLALQGAMPVEGGIPLMMEGKIVGAIGASGGSAEQDGQTARAGAAAVR